MHIFRQGLIGVIPFPLLKMEEERFILRSTTVFLSYWQAIHLRYQPYKEGKHLHPLRLIGLLLLAGVITFLSYFLLKPEEFSYAEVREGVIVEAGSPLQIHHIEQRGITVPPFSTAERPIPLLLSWKEVSQYIGVPVSRRLTGGQPLFLYDLENEETERRQNREENILSMSIPVDNVTGVTPHLERGDRVHVFASYEDEQGSHSGLLLSSMPVVSLQREMDGDVQELKAVTIGLGKEEAVLLTHALHYGKVRLGQAFVDQKVKPGVGDAAFAAALMQTSKQLREKGGKDDDGIQEENFAH